MKEAKEQAGDKSSHKKSGPDHSNVDPQSVPLDQVKAKVALISSTLTIDLSSQVIPSVINSYIISFFL